MKHPIRGLANIITSIRIVGAICLFFLSQLSLWFLAVYTICGATDALDGWIARKTHSESALGAVLDSIADLLFYTSMLLRLLPILWQRLPRAFWLFVGAAALIRIASYSVAAIKYHRFASLHTLGNKLTGFLLFALPYWMPFEHLLIPCIVICAAAGISSLEELLIHLLSREYNPDTKTLVKAVQLRKGNV